MFYDKFKEYCKKKGVSCNRAALDIGLSESTPTTWKKRGLTPRSETLSKIAEYFEVSVDELLGNEQKEKPTAKGGEPNDVLFNEAAALMERLSPEAQDEAMRYLRYLASESTKSEDKK